MAIAMAFKLIESAQSRWRAVNGPHLAPLVRAGDRFRKGKLVERDTETAEKDEAAQKKLIHRSPTNHVKMPRVDNCSSTDTIPSIDRINFSLIWPTAERNMKDPGLTAFRIGDSSHSVFRNLLYSVLACFMAVTLCISAGSAAAEESSSDAASSLLETFDEAVAEENAPDSALNADLEVPGDSNSPVSLDAGDDDIEMSLPAQGEATVVEDTTMFDGVGDDSSVALQSTAGGFRALVHIESPEAPERFDFNFSGAVDRLEGDDSGGVVAYSADEQAIALINAPWARDANGKSVSTHFEITGTTLTQVVQHRGGDWAYGITADPSLWKIAKCVAAIAWVVGSSIFAISKITKIKGAIKGLGGIKQTARLLLGATSKTDKLRVLGRAGAGAGSYFLGIDTIRNNC